MPTAEAIEIVKGDRVKVLSGEYAGHEGKFLGWTTRHHREVGQVYIQYTRNYNGQKSEMEFPLQLPRGAFEPLS